MKNKFLTKQIARRRDKYIEILQSDEFNNLDPITRLEIGLAVVENHAVDLGTEARYNL